MTLHRQVVPTLDRPQDFVFAPAGWIGERIRANNDNWLIPAPASNDGMVEMFAHRADPAFHPDPVPWAGEFAGKYLLSAVQSLQLGRNPTLVTVVNDVVQRLLQAQGADGSLGLPLAWDLWGQYHVMLGLLRWYEFTGNVAPLQGVIRAADLVCARYLTRPQAIADDHPADAEKNQAVAHVLALLHQHTGEDRYLALAKAIEVEWAKPEAGNYILNAQAGREFYQCGRPRWESLHDVQAIVELYYITGMPYYRAAFEQIWRSIQANDRRITGGFSSCEAATGNPYDPRYIETCGTVAWMALTIDMLRLTADPAVADELELSLFNAILGAQSPDGRLWTYHTPMGGVPLGQSAPPGAYLGYRFPALFDLDWQERYRYPQLSCCAANGPRGLGCLAEWAVLVSPDAVVVNYYGAGVFHLRESGGSHVVLEQETAYPVDATIRIRVNPGPRPTWFTIRLRIPTWSQQTNVAVNGEQHLATTGTYCEVSRQWVPGDLITITLDLTPRIAEGQRDADGLAAVLRGPLVLAYDERLNGSRITPQRAVTVDTAPAIATNIPGTRVVARYPTGSGDVALCDFASAGQSRAGALPSRPDTTVAWQFSRADGQVLAEQIRLRPDGTIEGHTHPNEARWGFEGDVLTFYTSSGAPSTRFTMHTELGGRQVLRGALLLDPSIHHVLTETGTPLPSTWQFVRRQGGTETVLLPRLRLVSGGGFDVPTDPSESRWSMDGGTLVLHAADGSVSTRFDSTVVRGGRAELSGQFAFDPTIRHVLYEVDPNVVGKLWRFWRLDGDPIDDNVRLLTDHTIDGHQHPNERTWGFEDDTLVFYDSDGRASTRFTTFRAQGGVMRYEGPYLGNPAITHALTERGADFELGSSYVVWLRYRSFDRELQTS